MHRSLEFLVQHLLIMSGADPKMAVTFAIPFSMLGLLLNQVYMTVNDMDSSSRQVIGKRKH